MQGTKKFKPRLFVNFNLDDAVPDDNFYKVLRKHLNLDFVYKLTKEYYSHTGRPGIDSVVFFKILLVGYLENLCSDRAVERMIQNRLDLRLFIGYDIDEAVPDHSTICKTRQRIPVEIFTTVFDRILCMCVQAGLVKGTTQSIDSAYINANASLDRMAEVKLVDRDPKDYLNEILEQDKEDYSDDDIDKANRKAAKHQRSLEKGTESRRKKYSDLDGGKQHRKNKRRFLSNATHQSKTDPDARIAKKSGKPRMLCYTSMMSVDTESNVITNISAEHSNKKDSRLLPSAINNTIERLACQNLFVDKLLADAGFSSGENYSYLEYLGIDAYIPIHGTFKAERRDFKFLKTGNYYRCRNGKKLTFRGATKSGGYLKYKYMSSKKDCDNCPIRNGCVDKRGDKKIEHTVHREKYLRMIKKLKSEDGRKSYALRMQTVEPVFGSLQQYYGLRCINTRGLKSAKKIMLMAGAAFNLKKWFKKSIQGPLFSTLEWIIYSNRLLMLMLQNRMKTSVI